MIAEHICLQDIYPALSSLPSPTPLTAYCRDTLTELKPRRFPAVIICPAALTAALPDARVSRSLWHF